GSDQGPRKWRFASSGTASTVTLTPAPPPSTVAAGRAVVRNLGGGHMRGIRSALLGALAVALTVTSWGALGGTAVAKAAKVSCNPKTAVKEIEPLLDIEASVTNPMKKRLATLQFGNLKEVAKQV